MHAYVDGDARVLYLHARDDLGMFALLSFVSWPCSFDFLQGSETPEGLVAMLFVFLSSHVVVILDTFFDMDWVRLFRMLQELKRGVSKCNPCPYLLVSAEMEPVPHSEIVALLSEYRNLNDTRRRLFKLFDSEVAASTEAVLEALGTSPPVRPLVQHLNAKRDLTEMARSILSSGSEPDSLVPLFAPAPKRNADGSCVGGSGPGEPGIGGDFGSRRVVGACCCGQRQLALRDIFDVAMAPCCLSVAVPMPGGAPHWALSRLPPGTPLGPGFTGDTAPLLSQKGVSYGIEYECQSGHRFFLSESMSKVVLRLKSVDKVISSDVPIHTKCLSCKDSSDSGLAQLSRLYVCCQAAIRVVVDPCIKYSKGGSGPKAGQGPNGGSNQGLFKSTTPMYSFQSPCGPMLLNCSNCCYVVRLPRVYLGKDGSPLIQKEVNSPWFATLEPWLKIQ